MTIQTISQRIPKRPEAGWQEQAQCRDLPLGADYDPFFMLDEERFTPNKWDTAKRICGECPVRRECLQDAIATEAAETFRVLGFRAGMTPSARNNLIRKLKERQ